MRPIAFLFALLTCSAAGASIRADDELTQEKLEEITAEIREDIEEMRGQEFPRPVSVAVTDAEGFLEYVKARIDAMTTPEELAAEELTAKLFGLIPYDMDYLGEMIELVESQVGGFYDPSTEGFYLMSSFTGGMAKIILAHELVHALDDQLYDLDGGFEARKSNADALWAYQALVEGSGTALMNRWSVQNMATLDVGDMMEMAQMGMDELKEAQPFLYKPLLGAYVRGEKFLQGEEGAKSNESVKKAFAAPPLSSEQVLHPEKYWDPEERDDPVAVEIDAERLPDGWTVLAENTMGELQLALLTEPLKKRKGIGNPLQMMAVQYTSKAAKGWGGDRYVLLAKGDARVIHLASTWDREKDAIEFHAAVEELVPYLEDSVGGFTRWQAERQEVFAAAGVGVKLERDGSKVFLTIGFGAGDEVFAKGDLGWAVFPDPEDG